MKPLVLDLCCGAGGAAKGYADAGFEVIGVDLYPQKNFPYEFVRHHALSVLRALLFGRLFHAGTASGKYLVLSPGYISLIHMSAPCQCWSRQVTCRPGLAEKYPDLITPARPLLRRLHEEHGVQYVMENVPEAPLENPVMLCGTMFGYPLYRHRHFEASWELPEPPWHPPHLVRASRAGHWEPGTIMSVAGHVAPVSLARQIMAIDWTTRDELTEAIPPYYTRWIAEHSPVLAKS